MKSQIYHMELVVHVTVVLVKKEIVKSENLPDTEETIVNRFVETAVVKSLFNGNDLNRRRFIKAVGENVFKAALLSVLPMGLIQSCANDKKKEVEKRRSYPKRS